MIKIDAVLDRALTAAQPDEQINDSMHTILTEGELEDYGNVSNVMKTIVRNKFKGLIAVKVVCIYEEGSEVRGQTQIKEIPVNRLQLGNKNFFNAAKAESARFLETIAIALISCRTSNDVLLERFERWSNSEKLMSAIVKQTVNSPLFIRQLSSFIKQHVESTTEECPLTQLYAKREKANTTGV